MSHYEIESENPAIAEFWRARVSHEGPREIYELLGQAVLRSALVQGPAYLTTVVLATGTMVSCTTIASAKITRVNGGLRVGSCSDHYRALAVHMHSLTAVSMPHDEITITGISLDGTLGYTLTI